MSTREYGPHRPADAPAAIPHPDRRRDDFIAVPRESQRARYQLNALAHFDSCQLARCDGTELGHQLALEFPDETAAVDDALARLREVTRRDR